MIPLLLSSGTGLGTFFILKDTTVNGDFKFNIMMTTIGCLVGGLIGIII